VETLASGERKFLRSSHRAERPALLGDSSGYSRAASIVGLFNRGRWGCKPMFERGVWKYAWCSAGEDRGSGF